MRVDLHVERGRTSVRQITLRSFPTVVGRHRSCRLQITSRQVSREHCVFEEHDGLLTVRDLESSNGTLVNGRRISIDTLVEPGDRVDIGPVSFRVEYDSADVHESELQDTDQGFATRDDDTSAAGGDASENASTIDLDDAQGFTIAEESLDSDFFKEDTIFEPGYQSVSDMLETATGTEEEQRTLFENVDSEEPPLTLFDRTDEEN